MIWFQLFGGAPHHTVASGLVQRANHARGLVLHLRKGALSPVFMSNLLFRFSSLVYQHPL